MPTRHLDRLTTVRPRDVWLNEAHDFTPWLLDNADVLGELLGMDLELEVAEHPIGGFSLDLLGRDSNGGVVIVENQLEQSDHSHLGQILTYAGGTNPATIVWISAAFRAEHRAALDWLNEHTDPDTRFFGVQVQVVRIGDSAPAPNFKLVAQPNDYQKQVRAATTSGPVSEKAQLYWDFWEQFRARVAADHPEWKGREGPSRFSANSTLPTGSPRSILVSAFKPGPLRLELAFTHPDPAVNLTRFEALYATKDRFEEVLGEPAVWDEMSGRKDTRVYVTSPFEVVDDRDQWPAMMDWLIDAHVRFRRAIRMVGGLDT